MSDRARRITVGHLTVALVGAGTQLVAGFFVAFSSLVAPAWGVGVLWAVWIATTVWGVRNWRRRVFAPLIAVSLMVLFWVAFLNFGDHVLGWTA
jgi:hypothetical protein